MNILTTSSQSLKYIGGKKKKKTGYLKSPPHPETVHNQKVPPALSYTKSPAGAANTDRLFCAPSLPLLDELLSLGNRREEIKTQD